MARMTLKHALTGSLLPLACAVMASTGAVAQTSPPAEAAIAGATTTSTTLTAPDGRVIDLTVIAPAAPRGVILFSHGGNSNPLATPALHMRLTARGFAVIAPTHTDSQSLSPERQTSLMAAFTTRVTDMKLAAEYAGQAFPGLPMAQVGYSYGSLTSLIGGGAFTGMVPGSNPGVKAVVMFSSPGPIPMLTNAPGAFDGVKGPTLLVTGDADIAGFAQDPAAHLVYFDSLPEGDHTALVVAGATHAFLGAKQPGWDEVAGIVDDFLMSRVLDDPSAGARFAVIASSAMVTVKRK
jgi:alpha-beta hydrolase superfamily lysophospholipase